MAAHVEVMYGKSGLDPSGPDVVQGVYVSGADLEEVREVFGRLMAEHYPNPDAVHWRLEPVEEHQTEMETDTVWWRKGARGIVSPSGVGSKPEPGKLIGFGVVLRND